MTKRLILLILALPLFLMICLFTATSGVSLAVPISVSKIELLSDSTVYMNLDNPKEKHLVEYAIYPTNAANKDVSISYLPLEKENGEKEVLAQFEYDEETGYLKPLAPGVAEVVITTIDGGYSVRFTVIVETRELVSIESKAPNFKSTYDESLQMDKYALEPGDTFKIENNFNPLTASNLLVDYSSSNPKVATVNARGVVKVVGVGEAVITVTSRANSYISYSFAIKVEKPENQAIIIVDRDLVSSNPGGKIDMSIVTDEEYEIEYNVVDKDGNIIDEKDAPVGLDLSKDHSGILYNFNDDYYGVAYVDVKVTTKSGEVTAIRCSLTRTNASGDDEMSISFDDPYYVMGVLTKEEIFFTINDEIGYADYSFDVECSDYGKSNILAKKETIRPIGNSEYGIAITTQKTGVTLVTISATNNETGRTAKATIPIVITTAINAEQPSKSDIEGSHTIGRYNADGSDFEYYLNYSISKNVEIGDGFSVVWESNNEAVFVDENGKIIFSDDAKYSDFADFVKFTAKFYYEGKLIESSTVITIRCVANGYNVTSYMELLELTRAEKIIVLQNDIDEDFGKASKESTELLSNDKLYTEMYSTYDVQWYLNQNRKEDTKIKVLISFKEDVYGNGHTINANNVVSYGQKGSGNGDVGKPNLETYALFRGPLYYVAITSSGNGVSVAGQDNICFAAYDGVKLNSVELVGREMVATDGNYNLQQLHYAGTVLEVLGNVDLEYSKVRNGRNVIRAFGDESGSEFVLNITNSILSNGRDFIMRTGSNAFVNGSKENPAPSLGDEEYSDGINYNSRLKYAMLSKDEREKYDSRYIRAYVNIHNSVFENPGILAIGVDSHFASLALMDATDLGGAYKLPAESLAAWTNLSKTSYGVKLSLSGDVRLYCWKTLNTVDSSSLIETSNRIPGVSEDFYQQIEFVISDLVRNIVKSEAKFRNAIYNAKVNEAIVNNPQKTWYDIWEENKPVSSNSEDKIQNYDMIHAGIVFFGGGKNYSILDTTEYTNVDLSKYEVSLNSAGKYALQMVAGQESFYFYIYDSTTKGFLPEDQERMLNSKDKYNCIYN